MPASGFACGQSWQKMVNNYFRKAKPPVELATPAGVGDLLILSGVRLQTVLRRRLLGDYAHHRAVVLDPLENGNGATSPFARISAKASLPDP